MGSHPINLAVRFLLELAALGSAAIWGWQTGTESMRLILAIGLPLALAVIWGVFAVPGDPSRSGKTVIPTPGFLRLILELAFFGFAVWALRDSGYKELALYLGIVTAFHYLLSYDRIRWLLRH